MTKVHLIGPDQLGYVLGVIAAQELDGSIEVVVRQYKKSRSLAQNNLLHYWVGDISKQVFESQGRQIAPEWFKEYFKTLFLGQETTEIKGKSITMTRSTAKLKTGEFSELLDRIDHYCNDEWGIRLPHPDYYDEAMK